MILWPKTNPVNEPNDAAFNAFLSSVDNIHSSTTVECQADIQECKINPVRECVVPKVTNSFCPIGLPTHHLKLKNGVPVMVNRNLFHQIQVNGKMLVLKAHTRRVVQVAIVNSNGNQTDTHASHRMKFLFSYHRIKATRKQFLLFLAFAGTVHKDKYKH